MAGNIIPIIQNGTYNSQWLKDIQGLPSVEVLERNLIELFEIDKSNMTPEEIKLLFFEKVVLFPNSSMPFSCEDFNKGVFWRVRTKVGDTEDLRSPSTFSYPKECLTNGRANLKNQPVFYCSLNRYTSLFEAKPEIGDVMYISSWTGACNRTLLVRYLFSDSLPKANPLFELAQRQLEEIKKMSRIYGADKGAQLELISRFLGNVFIHEEYPYPLTSWLANDIMFGKSNIDMLLYPSVTCNQANCNIALTPSFVDAHLKIKNVYKVQVTKKIGTKMSFNVFMVADLFDDKLVWRTTTEADMQYLDNKKRLNK